MVKPIDTYELKERSAPVTPQIHRVLREQIVFGTHSPGTRLTETTIARSFGVSRQPVREAFIKLADEGLLEVLPQRGTFVCKISLDAVLDARFLREAIEADIVKLVAEKAEQAVLNELNALLEAQKAIATDAVGEFVHLDDSFHRTLAEAAGKRSAWRVIEGLKTQMDRVRHLRTTHFPAAKLVSQHSAIVTAVAKGDPSGAERAMRKHLQEIFLFIPKIREAFPEYFEPSD